MQRISSSKLLKITPILLASLLFQACPYNFKGYEYPVGSLPETPVNFTEINSEYDDYNMSSPVAGNAFPLCFSSTRNSEGVDFDLVYKFVSVEFSKTTGELKIFSGSDAWSTLDSDFVRLKQDLGDLNSEHNELGPNLILQEMIRDTGSYSGWYRGYILMYSHDGSGSQDIYFTQNFDNKHLEPPIPWSAVNSPADEAYPCISANGRKLYLCSDRDGQNGRKGDFDIYHVPVNPDIGLEDWLSQEALLQPERDSILSSPADDKCPFLARYLRELPNDYYDDNVMIFASNREGSYGGYDLYYALYRNGSWEEPVNFGPAINSEYDEYRPIVKPMYDFNNQMMIFSSNRPGGLGGFDLYYVGIELPISSYY